MPLIIIFVALFSLSFASISNAANDDHRPRRINKQCIMRYLCDETGQYCRWNKFCDKVKKTTKTTTTKTTTAKPTSSTPAVSNILSNLTSDKTSLLQQRIETEERYAQNPWGIILYRPNYILPYYHTGSPYQSIYEGNTPDDQRVMHSEFKSQLSLMTALWPHILGPKTSLNIAYTQLSYWQFYAKSQYFRETNYEPEIFFSNNFTKNWLYSLGAVHESNGRGGELERSWNRVYVDVKFSGSHWLVSVKPWLLIFQNDSSNLHNPDIAHFLGHERILVAYKLLGTSISLTAQNIESGFKRGSIQAEWAIPITEHINAYVQYFSGYGQSLIEYNHRTQSVGVGISLNAWT